MRVEAILTRSDLARFADDLCPLHVRIGDGGNILFADPRDLVLVPGIGVRFTVSAEVHWPVLGLHIPVHVRSATLEVRPKAQKRRGSDCLSFAARIDDVDVEMLPRLADHQIVDHLNKAFAAHETDLTWDFGKALRHAFGLPDRLASAEAIDLSTLQGDVLVTSEALVLSASFRAAVVPRGVPAPSVAA